VPFFLLTNPCQEKGIKAKIKEGKQVGEELFQYDRFPTNGSVSTGEVVQG